MIEIIKYIVAGIALGVTVYILSKIQMHAWLKVIEQFLNEKSIKSKTKIKENEQKKKE